MHYGYSAKVNIHKQLIEGEHKKGEEMTNMTSSRFKIQMEKTEQLRLF